MKILVIEEDAGNGKEVMEVLHAEGHRAVVVADSAQAMLTAGQEEFDLVLWWMPRTQAGSNGHLLHEMAAAHPGLPVITVAMASEPSQLEELIRRFLASVRTNGVPNGTRAASAPSGEPVRPGARISIKTLEREHIRRIVERTDSLAEAADVLGIDAATLYRKRKRYGIPVVGN